MALKSIEHPVAIACVRWVSAEDGGRRTGPPNVAVYASTAVFCLGSEEEIQPGWPAQSDKVLSILIQRAGNYCEDGDLVEIGFLVPDLAWPYLHAGVKMLVLEGPKVVAHMVVYRVCDRKGDVGEAG